MTVEELSPGLWRWTTRRRGAPDGEAEAGSVYCEAGGDVLLIDPLLPDEPEERERFWRALDRDVARVRRAPHVLLTTSGRHRRSAADVVGRYGDACVWLPSGAGELGGLRGARTFTRGELLPGDAVPLAGALPGEVLFWLPSHRALVSGDMLLGGGDGAAPGLRLSPRVAEPAGAAAALWERLRGLPVELVLPSHGAPVRAGARDALERAIAG